MPQSDCLGRKLNCVSIFFVQIVNPNVKTTKSFFFFYIESTQKKRITTTIAIENIANFAVFNYILQLTQFQTCIFGL